MRVALLKYFFSNVPVAGKIPYVFGGVTPSKTEINSFGKHLFTSFFGSSLSEGLIMAYKNTLGAIADNDI